MTLMRATLVMRGGLISPCRLPPCHQSLLTRRHFFGLHTTVSVGGLLATKLGLTEGSRGTNIDVIF
jgi:hypothetical protein